MPKAGSSSAMRSGTATTASSRSSMINLATLTGAIMVALGNHHAGLFSNDDALAGQLTAAGLADAARRCGACRSARNTTS